MSSRSEARIWDEIGEKLRLSVVHVANDQPKRWARRALREAAPGRAPDAVNYTSTWLAQFASIPFVVGRREIEAEAGSFLFQRLPWVRIQVRAAQIMLRWRRRHDEFDGPIGVRLVAVHGARV